ncbi:MAG: hypothetical protein H0W50_11095 [Parachlamydiaceae bacterium]|nr:hypothetical protein [Parachlamydiaceae bacterium]
MDKELYSEPTPPSNVLKQNEVFSPESILAEGVDYSMSTNPYTGEFGQARKGTVAATLNNIALLNKLLFADASLQNQVQISKVIDAVFALLSSLRVVGMFDLFTPDEWLSNDDQPGRALIATLYLQKYPQNVSSKVKDRLIKLHCQTKFQILSVNIAMILNKI